MNIQKLSRFTRLGPRSFSTTTALRDIQDLPYDQYVIPRKRDKYYEYHTWIMNPMRKYLVPPQEPGDMTHRRGTLAKTYSLFIWSVALCFILYHWNFRSQKLVFSKQS